MPERSLETELTYLKGVGPKLAERFAKLGLFTVGDLLFTLPRRYEDRRSLPPIMMARPGDPVTIRARVVAFERRSTSRGQVIMKATVRDSTGAMALVWFNQPSVAKKLEAYRGEIVAYGPIKQSVGAPEMSVQEWEMLEDESDAADFARITPVYGLTEGLGGKTVRRAVARAVDEYLDLVEETLPKAFREAKGLPSLKWALQHVHFPDSEQNRLAARKRLVYEEFLVLQVGLQQRRAETAAESGIAFPVEQLVAGGELSSEPALPDLGGLFEGGTAATPGQCEPLWDTIHRMLPFELTGAQRRVIGDILRDMGRPHPMNRLVQGDVGSGKTAVAAACMLAAVRSGYQAALMAPTEILAEQHAANLKRLFEPLGIEVDLLVGKLTAAQKRRARERTARGLAHIAVGTHALVQEGVEFHRLGFVVIDEQHRFGVLQRKALRDKGLGNPDVLVMTATPIPRTLTMTLYGDLDVSLIDELPPGRKAIRTRWVPPGERDLVYEGLRKLLHEGRQAYFVCPLVSENENMLAQAAEEMHRRLSHEVYPEFRVGLLHGQLKAKEKEAVMEEFRRGHLHILVSTTVIEVGVDVPNATTMVIEDANRFGLSQLHQLRGRVGRGDQQSYCILIAEGKGEDARARMEAMVRTNDGFVIADEDLRLRGPGDIAGTRQSGLADLRYGDLLADGRLLEEAREDAIAIVAEDPGLLTKEWSRIKPRVTRIRQGVEIASVS